MEKTVNIGGKEYKLVANGATPRVYRGLFKKDVFNGMQNAVTSKGEILDSEVFENLAFCMAVQGGSLSIGTKIEDWLAEMKSPMSIVEVAAEVMELWSETTATTSNEKKG